MDEQGNSYRSKGGQEKAKEREGKGGRRRRKGTMTDDLTMMVNDR